LLSNDRCYTAVSRRDSKQDEKNYRGLLNKRSKKWLFKDKFVDFQSIRVNDSIYLRQVKPQEDLEAYFEIYADIDALRYYEGIGNKTPNRETVMAILNNQIKEFEKTRIYSWTITDGKTGKALGRILLSNFEGNNKLANIGYFLSRDSWEKGIISACVKAVTKFGFSYLELERIYTTVHPDNIASWKALENNGFLREGRLRHCFNLSDGLNDCYMYAKLSTDAMPSE